MCRIAAEETCACFVQVTSVVWQLAIKVWSFNYETMYDIKDTKSDVRETCEINWYIIERLFIHSSAQLQYACSNDKRKIIRNNYWLLDWIFTVNVLSKRSQESYTPASFRDCRTVQYTGILPGFISERDSERFELTLFWPWIRLLRRRYKKSVNIWKTTCTFLHKKVHTERAQHHRLLLYWSNFATSKFKRLQR